MNGPKYFTLFLRKKMLKLIKYLVFCVLILRMALLKVKHYGPRIVKRTFKKLNAQPKLLQERAKLNQNIFKQIFAWDLSENTIKIRLVIVILGFLLFFGIL